VAISRTLATTVAILFAGCLGNVASAQTKICVIDMAKVFKAHAGFNQQMQALKTEADAFQQQLQHAQQGLAAMNEELRKLDANSPQFATKESEIAQESANLEVERRTRVRELMVREARIHFDAYAGITTVISQFCHEQNVPLVIRFVSDPMKLDDPASIEQAYNSNVVFYNQTRDITDEIIRRVAQAPASTQR
jgi:Skp family chaperone for outer membrane proteins